MLSTQLSFLMIRQSRRSVIGRVARALVPLASFWLMCCRPAIAGEKTAGSDVGLRIEGRFVECINVAFEDYAKGAPEPIRAPRYYLFSVYRDGKLVRVEIVVNQQAVLAGIGYSFKGGGARYGVDPLTSKVVERQLFK